MSEHWKTWATSLGAIASIAVLAVTTCDPGLVGVAQDRGSQYYDGEHQSFVPWQDKTEDVAKQAELEPQPVVNPPTGHGFWVRFYDDNDRYVDANALVSAPGMWPFVSMDTKVGGFLQLPDNQVPMMGGRAIQLYEVLVRSDENTEKPGAFWGVIRGPDRAVAAEHARTIRLQDAYPLEMTIVDEDDEPIEGAFVRVSRDSIGLLHLNYTTEEDGRAVFRHIPQGVYYLTLDADDFSRQTVRVEHSGEGAAADLKIVLEGGKGLRLPQSWRGPMVSDLMDMSSGSSGEGGNIQDDQEGAEGEEGNGEKISLEVFAADTRGAGVDGAWLEAWVGGRRVAQGRSGGSRPTVMEVPAGVRVDIIATHAGWGEGSTSLVEADDGDDVIVKIGGELLSAAAASDRVRGLDTIEDALGARLVADSRRWLIERGEDGEIDTSGIERGDSLLFLRREGSRHRAVVERGSQVVEVTF